MDFYFYRRNVIVDLIIDIYNKSVDNIIRIVLIALFQVCKR